jgi:hypothetical protein
MKADDRKGIEKRIELIETGYAVFKKKSEEYKAYCISEYKKILAENNDKREWIEITKYVETRAKNKFNA